MVVYAKEGLSPVHCTSYCGVLSSVLKFWCDDSLAVVAQGMVELWCRINSARRKCLCTYLKFANTADALNTPVRTRQGTAMTWKTACWV